MTTARIYYRRERERHPALVQKRLTFREARRVARLLREAFGLTFKVRRHSTRRRAIHKAWFNPRRDLVVLPRGSTTLLVVVHEVAHALEWSRRPAERRRRGIRWHGEAHRMAVDLLADFATFRNWQHTTPAAPSRPVRNAAAVGS